MSELKGVPGELYDVEQRSGVAAQKNSTSPSILRSSDASSPMSTLSRFLSQELRWKLPSGLRINDTDDFYEGLLLRPIQCKGHDEERLIGCLDQALHARRRAYRA